jgi:glucosyl-3-phosphoglycerate phosphatase
MTDAPLVLVRHAESTWNRAGRWQGRADPPLSPRGRGQAEALGRALAGQALRILLASDLARAAETARVVGRALGIVPVFDARLRELDVGAWTGLTRREIERRDARALARFESGDLDAPAGGAETRGALRARVQACLAEWIGRPPGGGLAIIAHLGVMRAIDPGAELSNAQWWRLRAVRSWPCDAIEAARSLAGHG